jgi:cyclopropane-fatty-acyl-phospholipid synthase
LDRWLIRRLMLTAEGLPLEVALWDGQVFPASDGPADARMTIHTRSAIRHLCFNPCLGFGDGYMTGEITVSGDLVRFCEIAEQAARQAPRWYENRIWRWLHWLTPNTRAAAQGHIQHHYDLGNEFYKLWLDEEMAYTCAYFADPVMDLAEAQKAKFDHVARKLRLQPGMRVVEAGCGWGGLALHLARHYGVSVQAYNISKEQVAYARQRTREVGLSGQVTFIEDDWRTMGGQFDAFVSVGMLEHVGPENFRELGQTIRTSLKPEGLGLIHTIGRNSARPVDSWTEKRIFPGSCPPSLNQMMAIFESPDFSVLDVENLRLHYARTLEFWRDNFESHSEEVERMFDLTFVRMWRLYLNASIAAFRSGGLQLFQVVFAHGQNNAIPWTRADIYAKAAS